MKKNKILIFTVILVVIFMFMNLDKKEIKKSGCICNSLDECKVLCPTLADEYCEVKGGVVNGEICEVCSTQCDKWEFISQDCIPTCFEPPPVPG